MEQVAIRSREIGVWIYHECIGCGTGDFRVR